MIRWAFLGPSPFTAALRCFPDTPLRHARNLHSIGNMKVLWPLRNRLVWLAVRLGRVLAKWTSVEAWKHDTPVPAYQKLKGWRSTRRVIISIDCLLFVKRWHASRASFQPDARPVVLQQFSLMTFSILSLQQFRILHQVLYGTLIISLPRRAPLILPEHFADIFSCLNWIVFIPKFSQLI